MRIIGMINHYLVSAMMTAALIWVICLGVNLIRKKLVNVKVWIIRYVMITYLVSVFMITDAYKAFVEGIPDFFISPNFIPVYNFIMDVGSNPVETLMQAIYNIVLLIPFGVLLPPSLPEYSIRLKKVLVITVAFVVIVEVMEYLSGRYMDIDDIILNTFGSMIGYFIYCFFCIRESGDKITSLI